MKARGRALKKQSPRKCEKIVMTESIDALIVMDPDNCFCSLFHLEDQGSRKQSFLHLV